MKSIKSFFLLLLIVLYTNVIGQDAEDTVMLETVVISDKFLDEYSFNVTNHIERSELEKSEVRDVGEFLRSIPNVSGIRRGGSAIDPVVRGYKYSQLNVILNNGIRIEGGCPNRMDPVTSHIEAEDIDHIEITKGPFSMKYGPSFGGMINLVSMAPSPAEEFEIHVDGTAGFESNWNGRKFSGSISGGNRKVYFQAGGGYRNYGNYESGSREGLDTTFIAGFRKYNMNAKLGFSINPLQNLILSWNGIHGRDVMFPALPMDERSDDTNMYSIDYQAEYLSPLIRSLEAKIYLSDVYHVMDNSHRPSYATMQMVSDVNAVNTGGRASVSVQLGKHGFTSGIDYEHIYKDGKRVGVMNMMGTTSQKTSNLWLDALISNTGVFTEYKTFFSSYELFAGLRLDYNTASSGDTIKVVSEDVIFFDETASEFFNVSASLGIRKKINKWMDISVGIGRGTRSPNMLERYIKLLPVGYDRYDYLGNPLLKPEINNEIDLTFEMNPEMIGSFYVNFFYSYVTDYISANLLPSSIIKPQSSGVLGVKQFYNADHITSRGFEFGFRSAEQFKLGGDFIAAFTYGVIPQVTKYVINGSEVVDEVEITNDALPEIPPFEATMNIYYRLLEGNLIPRITVRAVARQGHISEAFYEQPTPGFCVLNISAKYRINRFTEINAGIMNVLDRSYYEHLNRRIIGSDISLYEPGRVLFATLFVKI